MRTIDLHEVRSKNNPLIGAPNRKRIEQANLPDEAAAFLLSKCGSTRANRAIVAYYKNEIVGFFRFRIRDAQLNAWGTWVRKDMRSLGLATRLWKEALQAHHPKSVVVYTVSRAGRGFIASLTKMDGLGLIQWYT